MGVYRGDAGGLVGALALDDLSDVTATSPSDGYIIAYSASTQTWVAQTNPSGVTDHGALTGLTDDDHTQYFNTTRGDSRYLQLSGGTMTGALTMSAAINVTSGAHFTSQAYFTAQSQNSNTNSTIDWTSGNKVHLTLDSSPALTFTGPSGPTNLLIKLIQDASGSRTVTWPAAVKWSGGTTPTLSTSANSVDVVSFYFDGTNYYGSFAANFS